MEHAALWDAARANGHADARASDTDDSDTSFAGVELAHVPQEPRPRAMLSPAELLWYVAVADAG